jgi:predicted MFS family arabinose efflux permease
MIDERGATRLAFLVAGIGTAVWAALVPFAKARLALGSAELGVLLLCLGIGSLVAMPLTGMLASRFGCRPVILTGGAIGSLMLPALSMAPSAWLQGATLAAFGAAIGSLDVAMNIQAVSVEKAHGGALMSGFHGLFSLGGFLGAGGMSLLLWAGASPSAACGVMSAVMGVLLVVAAPHLLRSPAESAAEGAFFSLPHGAVILIGLLCFVVFLAEGAMLDWSAILLTTTDGFAARQGGLGYAVFAVAMTLGRLGGDRVVRRWGRPRVMLAGGLCTAAGFFGTVLAPFPWVALAGFLLIGAGASNIVPILFTAAGRQGDMPAGAAVSAITTIGYAGVLSGPALIGFIAQAASLPVAFCGLGCAMVVVAGCSRRVLSR